MDLGYFELGETLVSLIPILDSSLAPVDPTVAPTYRIYHGDELVSNGTGSLAKMDTGDVTGATNASPIVITSASHGLQTGTRVIVSGVGGNTAANGTFTITRVNANSFSLDGSTGNGAYTSGGTWHVAGAYVLEHELASGDGFEAGEVYKVLITYTVSSDTYSFDRTFLVT
jgi:hypothetical protein